MNIKNVFNCGWLRKNAPDSCIVISSRIRLARNINKIPFPHWADEKNLKKAALLIQNAAKKCSYLVNSECYDLNKTTPLDKQYLIEKHLISPEQAISINGYLIAGDKEMISIMINEEDHLRIQSMDAGLNLFEAWDIINKLDSDLSDKLNYAISPQWGYLTACPTNVGTGMRASVMMHLPALILTGQINKVLKGVSQLGLAIRGLYGEGTKALGNLYQISNQVTLGQAEEETIDYIKKITNQIIGYEKDAQEVLTKESNEQLEDKIFRAYALLTHARIISSSEAMDFLSTVRLGVSINLLKNVSLEVLNELLIVIQPAHIQKIYKSTLTPEQRDIKRAELIREKLLIT
ncbi:MAG: protein arginine kinase [bacterium]|nr:protein arginine kinase [bacterium]